MSQLLKYEYYDTPEGQDIFMKTFAISKYAALAGTALASMDVLMYSHPKGFVATAGRFAWFLGPMVGMAAGFAVTANTVQNIRGKNDKLNYFLGGVVSGSIFTAWMRVGVIAVPAAVILGAAAVVKKTAIDEGWSFFPSVPHATQSARSVKYDWTLVKDIEELKNFTTGSN